MNKECSIEQIATAKQLTFAMNATIPDLTIDDVIFLCIGTDRSTGDSLAPLVGTKLRKRGNKNVYGTLEDPVHALNLKDVLETLPKDKKILAIDACLGKESSVGTFSIKNGSLKPGEGVGKDLPEVGDWSILGTVNVGGFMPHLVLQNTRLATVMKMADDIAKSIYKVFPLPKKKRVALNT